MISIYQKEPVFVHSTLSHLWVLYSVHILTLKDHHTVFFQTSPSQCELYPCERQIWFRNVCLTQLYCHTTMSKYLHMPTTVWLMLLMVNVRERVWLWQKHLDGVRENVFISDLWQEAKHWSLTTLYWHWTLVLDVNLEVHNVSTMAPNSNKQ